MAHDPYKPPAAPVADVEAPASIARPLHVTWGIRLLWASLVASLPAFLEIYSTPMEWGEDMQRAFMTGFTVMVVVMLGLLSWLTIMAWRGRNWARIVHLAWFLLGILAGAWAWSAMEPEDASDFGLVDLLSALLNVAGLALLFTPAANAWYRAMRERRRAQ